MPARHVPHRLALAFAAGTTITSAALAQDLPSDGDTRVISPWAGPGLLDNPVSFTMDWAGNVYIAESDRAGQAVTDTRQLQHLNGVEEDLRLMTVEDRRALIQKWLDAGAFPEGYFTDTEDRVRMVRDTDGDGVADASTVFAGGFNDAVDGIGAGVLWRDGSLYYTCIPHLWRLADEDGDGTADERESLSYGYGVRWCFYGHDLHGLVNGPDGRIYFSMGDRGYNIQTPEGRHIVGPDRGAVFRCWPDGSGLELFHVGLRNPQELAFDEFGNLFTGDNNCDSGDRARVVYVLEGGDSGWRQNVQSLPSRGPWNREHMWELLDDPRDPSRPAWTLPPIDHVGAGPSGLAYYPGTGESFAYDDTMLMVDFYGSGSTVHSFRAVADGAGFRLTEKHEYYRGTTVTDIAWGPDSRLYLSDWGEGWGPNSKGNMFTIVNDTVHKDPRARGAIDEVRGLLREGFGGRSDARLIELMGHRDQRIRLAAQYELADRGPGALGPLAILAADSNAPRLQRVHAVWCVGQLARREPSLAAPLADLITDAEAEVRLAAVRTLGDLRTGPADALVAALADPSAQVRGAAAIALGKLGHGPAIGPMLDLLESNGDQDVFLRSAVAHGLALINDAEALLVEAEGRGRSARMGTVLALRRLGSIGVVPYLSDPDAGVAVEAARAVYDLYLDAGLPALAAKLDNTITPGLAIEPFLRRAIEANVYLGGPEEAARLARFAGDASIAPQWRRLAMQRLAGWDEPLLREGVWGDLVELPARPTDDARRAVLANLESMRAAAAGDADLLGLADSLGAKFSLEFDAQTALGQLADPGQAEAFRLVLLDQFAVRAPERLADATAVVLTDPAASTPGLRIHARSLLAEHDPDAGVASLAGAIEAGTTIEQQHAVRMLGEMRSDAAQARVRELLESLAAGEADPAVALEVFELAAARSTPAAEAAAARVTSIEPDRDAGFQTPLLMAGGDPEHGLDLFLNHEAAQCQRCHSVGPVGPIVGPNLLGVASRMPPSKLVESIVEPNAVVAEGYGQISSMPAMSVMLTAAEARDIVAYLATLVDPAVGPAPETYDPDAPPSRAGPASTSTGSAAPMSGRSIFTLIAIGLYVVVLVPVMAWVLYRIRPQG